MEDHVLLAMLEEHWRSCAPTRYVDNITSARNMTVALTSVVMAGHEHKPVLTAQIHFKVAAGLSSVPGAGRQSSCTKLDLGTILVNGREITRYAQN
jgi:hypothetical protein